ncbi:ubinuclein-1-like isoform X2 [Fagus crenata]
MEEDKKLASASASGLGVGGDSSSRASSSFVKAGDRQMFTVELRPGETTIVSWKKLMKDANKVNGSASTSAPEPPANAHPALESRLAPGQPTENEETDEPAPNRFSAVIEKIERLYMGKDSSDDEDLRDLPDDDQYDTEDSFIDDAELDEYFEVDNSAIKHDGFFVNRGKLERINEPTVLPNQQPKKRRRRDLEKGHGGNDDSHESSKHVKKGKTAATKIAAMFMKDSSSPSQNLAVTSENFQDVKFQNQTSAPGISSKKKSVDTKTIFDPSPSLKVSNGDASVSLPGVRDIDKQKTGTVHSKNLGDKLKDVSGSFDAAHQKNIDKSAFAQSKSLSGRTLNSVDQLESSIRPKEKNGIRELTDNNFSEDKYATMQTTKPTHIRKDGSSVRPKNSLEKAIRELERMVAESRPPAMENQEADTAAQAIKRRLPREIKLKLAKVARLAASQGRISKELLNRLMSILGHLIQLRTLKRNLKVMISMGLSAKQEQDDRFQQIKKEVVEMIKMQAPSLELKAFGQQAGASDDFQELCAEDKGVLKKKFSMDAALEDKICDLYDLFVDGLDEDAGPQIRKLYAELAELWPNGFMDNHGIKRAVCRAKDRRRALYNKHKEQEKIKRKKMLAPRIEDTVRVEANSIVQPQPMRERLSTETGSHGLTSTNRPLFNSTAAVRMHSPSTNGPLNLDRIKQEKLKGTSSNSPDDARVSDGGMPKKKVKRKPEMELDDTHFRPEKLPSQQGEEKHKSLKQAAGLPQKSNLQSTAPPSVEQSS